jgi:hypothetical protein
MAAGKSGVAAGATSIWECGYDITVGKSRMNAMGVEVNVLYK